MKHIQTSLTTFKRDYRKAYIKLLTGAANAPKAVDEYFFGTEEEKLDDGSSSDIRPYFYTAIGTGVAVLLLCCAISTQ